jgi:hypothetical protein
MSFLCQPIGGSKGIVFIVVLGILFSVSKFCIVAKYGALKHLS